MLKLTYNEYAEDGIFGTLRFYEDDKDFCVFLTHAYKQPDGSYKPIVEPGQYVCVLGVHQLENAIPFDTYEVEGVKGHSGILFHPGNWNFDSKGCFLLGKDIEPSNVGRMVTNSRIMFRMFMARLG